MRTKVVIPGNRGDVGTADATMGEATTNVPHVRLLGADVHRSPAQDHQKHIRVCAGLRPSNGRKEAPVSFATGC
jgi:hypothetical protein